MIKNYFNKLSFEERTHLTTTALVTVLLACMIGAFSLSNDDENSSISEIANDLSKSYRCSSVNSARENGNLKLECIEIPSLNVK